jgi:hypothetical protein
LKGQFTNVINYFFTKQVRRKKMKKTTIFTAIILIVAAGAYVVVAQQGGMMGGMHGGGMAMDSNNMMMHKGMGPGGMMPGSGGMMMGPGGMMGPGMCPMCSMMCQMMTHKSMVAVGDDVVVMAGNKLMKYDKNLNLVKEVELKIDTEQMQKKMAEMMKSCPMCGNMAKQQPMKGASESSK